MVNMKLDDTIAAISTPIGEGGIGIVRLSGRHALNIADKMFLSKDGRPASTFKSYTVHYGHIIERNHEQGIGKYKIIDEVILTVMRAPKSYTKEDVVEINCHSGIAPLKKILDLALMNGSRLAEPGEFTKRAFLNGRIDITQAEAVLDIIKAKTDLSLRAALNNLEGVFSKKIHGIRERLLDILALLETSIDFSEEENPGLLPKKGTLDSLKGIKKDIEKLLSESSHGKILRHGVKTVICGSPNVGKSSLMNAILRESRSIVTHFPGTTRDTIEEIVNIKGIPVILVDTAGITLDASHPAEKEGVRRSNLYLQNADLVLLVLDYGKILDKNDTDIMRSVSDNNKEVIIVINKCDLRKTLDMKKVRKYFSKKTILYVSALNMEGIDKLENAIKDSVWKGRVSSPDFIGISNQRHIEALHHCLMELDEALSAFKSRVSMDCVSIFIRSSIEHIGEITGHTITEEALDRIFSEFCIGK